MKKINNIKQFLLVLLAFAFIGVNQAWGYAASGSAVKQVGSTYYVLYETSESNFSTISSKEYELKGPGAQVYYDAKCVPILGFYSGDLKLAQKVNGKYGDQLFSEQPPKNSYKSYGPIGIDRNATNIKLYTETGATGRKYFKNVFVTMAQYVDDASASSIAFGSGYVNAANTTKSVTVAWCNVPAMTYEIVGTDADKFAVSVSGNSEPGKWGTATFNVSYKHTTAGNHNATLVIIDTYDGYSFEVSLSGSTQKNPNAIAWNVDEATWKNWNETLELNATTNNTDYTNAPIAYTSSNNDYASIADGVVTFFEAGAGKEVTITASQIETDAYLGASATKTFHILNAQTIAWDPTVVNTTLRLGTTRDISAYTIATPEGTRTITYTSSDPNVIEVHEDGVTIEGKSIGTAVLTATLAGDGQYREATSTKEFEVKDKEVAVISLGELILNENEEVNIYIGENSDALSSTNTAAALSCAITDESVVSYNVDTHQFESQQLGSTTVVISQEGNEEYPAVNRTITINVIRYQTVITANLEDVTLFVGENADVQFASNRENEEITVESSNAEVAICQEGKIIAVGEGAAYIIFSQAETDTWSAGEKKVSVTVNRRTASLSVKMNGTAQNAMTVYQGTSVAVTFDKVSDAEVEVTQIGGEIFASYNNGVLKASNEIGTAYFRATLPQTQEYKSASVEFSLTVQRAELHLPVTMNSSLWNSANCKVASEGSNSWDNTKGMVLGDPDGGGFNNDDKYVILHFEGIPDKLTFAISTDVSSAGSFFGGATNVEWYIQESATQNMGNTKIWTSSYDGSDASNQTVQLDPSTRYVKFCYSGNFGGDFRNVRISELKYVQEPTPAEIDFGANVINSGEVSKTFNINWCNVAPMTVSCDNPRFTVTPNTFADYELLGSQEITVSFTHGNDVGSNEGTITISNGNDLYTKTISVSAQTTKRQQTITWDATLVSTNYAMNVGEQYPDGTIAAVASTATGARVVLTSSNPEIIEVIADTALLAKAEGTVEITAYQAGDDQYDEVSDTKEFTVTNLLKQTITWDQNLYGLLTTSESVELTATATSGMEITYTSADPNVVRIEGNMLIVVGEGETTITATQAGGEDLEGNDWLAISLNNYVIVRNPASQCNGMALSVGSLTLNSGELSKIYDLAGTPTTLTFKAKHGTKPNGSWGQKPTYAALMVDQYAKIDGVWGWQTIYNTVVGTDDTNSGTIELDPSAAKIRFRTTETGTEHTISNVQVPRKKFMIADVEAVDNDIECNSIWSQTVTVSHSNIDLMTVTAKQGLINLNVSTLGGGCGDFGDHSFVASFTPMQKYVHYYDTIVITDGKAQPSTIEIPVHLYSKGLNQAIAGFEVPETAWTTDQIPAFHATASSELPVTYATSDENVARIVNDNVLEIVTEGTIQVYAIQAGNDRYDSTAIERTIVISKVASHITTIPVASEVPVGQTLAESFLTGGAADVEGEFTWANPSIVADEEGEHTYEVIFIPANEAWYERAVCDVTVSTTKTPAILETAPVAIEGLEYDGEEHALVEAGSALYGELQYSLDGENYSAELPVATNAGDYTIYYRVVGDESHSSIAAETIAASIAKIDPELTLAPKGIAQLEYADSALVLIEAGEVVGGTIEYSLDAENWSDELPTAIEAGEYTVYYRIVGDANHNSLDGDAISVTIVIPEEAKESQYITWEDELDEVDAADGMIFISAVASSGLPVSFTSSDSTIAYVEELDGFYFLYLLKGGEVTITAHQDGNDTYSAAEPIAKVINIISDEEDPETPTAVEDAQTAIKVQKIIRDNQVLIIREGRTYTTTGLLVE